jgi:hypothetical protein
MTLSTSDPEWGHLTDQDKAALCAWLRSCGADPDRTTAVALTGEGEIVATEMLHNERGHVYVGADGEVARRTAIYHPSTPPPVWPKGLS